MKNNKILLAIILLFTILGCKGQNIFIPKLTNLRSKFGHVVCKEP